MSKEKPVKKEERPDPWLMFLQTVTAPTKARLIASTKTPRPLDVPPPEVLRGEEHDAFAAFLAGLSPTTAECVTGMVAEAVDADPAPEVGKPCYGIVESEDGGWATCKLVTNIAALANRLSVLEGLDVVAWVFYGVPLQFTMGPQRYLKLPDGQHAVKLPAYGNGPHEIVDVRDMEDIDIQVDGFLGPPQLAEGHINEFPDPPRAEPGDWKKEVKEPPKPKKPPVDDDEEDHDDEDPAPK